MPTATLTYQLPEEQEEFDRAVRGIDCYIALCELDRHLRDRLKHEQDMTETVARTLEAVREVLRHECQERGIQL